MSNMSKAVQSVSDVHRLIENVFTGKNQQNDLSNLLDSFDENFMMVTISGVRIGLAQVESLFSQNVGGRPSLKITLSDMKPVLTSGDDCWVQYQEHHQTQEGETLRTSTVCIRVKEDKCTWLYLHETPVI